MKSIVLSLVLIFYCALNINAQTDKGTALYKTNKLQLNECLTSGQNKLILKQDGNLVFMVGNNQVWHSNTAGQGVNELVLQEDCNAVLYKVNNGGAAWSSGSLRICAPNVELVVQETGFGLLRGTWTQSGLSYKAYDGDLKAIYGTIQIPIPEPAGP